MKSISYCAECDRTASQHASTQYIWVWRVARAELSRPPTLDDDDEISDSVSLSAEKSRE